MLLFLDLILYDCYGMENPFRALKIRILAYLIMFALTFGYVSTGPLKDNLAMAITAGVAWPLVVPLTLSYVAFSYFRTVDIKLPSVQWSN